MSRLEKIKKRYSQANEGREDCRWLIRRVEKLEACLEKIIGANGGGEGVGCDFQEWAEKALATEGPERSDGEEDA